MELSISFIQSELMWENPPATRAHFNKLFNQLPNYTDLIVLPEMFTTGFSMHSEKLYEEMDGETVEWMRQQAIERNVTLCGSIIIREKNKYYNRLLWVESTGKILYYDKRHLFRMAEENDYFTPGDELLIVSLKGWKICPLICYDLRFPVWSRNINEQYDLLLYVANWPAARISAWEKLLFARAIENQCFVGAVNRIGIDGKGIQYSGNSVLIDPKGELIWKAKDKLEEIKTIQINKGELENFRNKFPVGKDADKFKVL